MNIVFMGTPQFAVPSLESLIKKFTVKAVFTQPDRPRGRGKKICVSKVKEVALKYGIPVFQPIKIKNDVVSIEKLNSIRPDFIIVVAFGQILSKEILDIPKYGCINLHASLLPKYRGAAPINWAIINGETKSGNTTMLMDVGVDTGDMLLKEEVSITPEMTFGKLHDKLMNSGSDLLVKTIEGVYDGSIVPKKQPEGDFFYAKMIDKKMANIDWNSKSSQICNLIRGLNPKPTAYTHYNGELMKIYEAESLDKNCPGESGTILGVSEDGIEVKTKDGVLLIKKIQFPGKKPLNVREYIRGNSITMGTILN